MVRKTSSPPSPIFRTDDQPAAPGQPGFVRGNERLDQLLADEALMGVIERITPPDIQASNVPGYAQETFLAGARVDRQYGMGPMPRVAMMAILISRAGTCIAHLAVPPARGLPDPVLLLLAEPGLELSVPASAGNP